MCDPQNLSIQDELRTFLGYEIRAVVATERDIIKALDRFYAASGESVMPCAGLNNPTIAPAITAVIMRAESANDG